MPDVKWHALPERGRPARTSSCVAPHAGGTPALLVYFFHQMHRPWHPDSILFPSDRHLDPCALPGINRRVYLRVNSLRLDRMHGQG
jgi:hypothetical protein